MRFETRRGAAALLILAAAACGPADPRRGSEGASRAFRQGFTVPMVNAEGRAVGTVSGTPSEQGLVVKFEVSGLSEGQHGMHLHSAGHCDPPGFASAGAHWSTAGRAHGLDNPRGPHDGDWGNLDIGADGRGGTDRLIPRWHGKIPDSGLSLVIHAGADDNLTDPDGKSGERVACGVIIPPAAAQ